ncbi:unnamed protein product, partial [Durusdinium trenchii]
PVQLTHCECATRRVVRPLLRRGDPSWSARPPPRSGHGEAPYGSPHGSMRVARGLDEVLLQLQGASQRAYRIAIGTLQKSSQWKEALAVFEHFQSRGSETETQLCNAALGAAAAGAAWRRALHVFAQTPSPDASSYTNAVTAMARAERWIEALQLFRRLPEGKMDLPARLLGIQLNGILGHHKAALALKPDSGRFNVKIYNACISALATMPASNARDALAARLAVKELLLEMRQRVMFTRVSYGAALQAFSKNSGWEEALDLLQEMSTVRLPPDAQ